MGMNGFIGEQCNKEGTSGLLACAVASGIENKVAHIGESYLRDVVRHRVSCMEEVVISEAPLCEEPALGLS